MAVGETPRLSADRISTEEFPMPHAAPNKAETAPNAPDRTSPPSGGPRPEPQPANSAPEPGQASGVRR